MRNGGKYKINAADINPPQYFWKGSAMDNKTRMESEMAYVVDKTLIEEMKQCKKLTHLFNTTEPWQSKKLDEIAQQLFGSLGKNSWINPPFYCDYGKHIFIGDGFNANYGCVILDVGRVDIGNNVFFAPNVSVYTAGHPVHPAARGTMYEYGISVKIGNDVWVGGNSVILPGVTIGDGTVIGAGSVVTKDIPSGVVAAGNPCRVIRKITDEDLKYYFKDREFDDEAFKTVKEAYDKRNKK